MPAGRTFHGLNGSELKHVILLEVKSDLTDRLAAYLDRMLRVVFGFKLDVDSYPSEIPIRVKFDGQVEGTGAEVVTRLVAAIQAYLDRDTNFGQHLTFPKMTMQWRLNPLDVYAPAESGDLLVPKPTPALVDEDRRYLDLTAVAAPFPFQPTVESTAPQEMASVVEALQRQMAVISEQIATLSAPAVTRSVRPVPSAVDRSGSEDRSAPTGQKLTGTGLAIRGGPRVSPGPSAAESFGGGTSVGVIAATQPVERIELGRDHPSLEEGGMGAPDAIRRDAGLPVPMPGRGRSGHIVDFPQGTF